MKLFNICVIFFGLLLLAFQSNGQSPVKKYEAEWKKVQAFIDKGLPKSALDDVKKIYTLAKKEKQDAQVIKSLIYISQLNTQTEGYDEISGIREFEKELMQSKEPATSVLNNILAGLYWQYYSQHRWTMLNRTETVGFVKDDISTWGTQDFHKKIGELFLLSIKNEKLLWQTNLSSMEPVIIKGNMRHLRPTLFDLLAHRALDYFKNDERELNRPSYAFEINEASALEPAADFIQHRFQTKDTSSLQYKALLLYQHLIRLHMNDSRPDALLDVDIDRIEYTYRKSVHPDKDQLYINSLTHISSQYGALPAAAQASYLLASYYNQKANTYTAYGDPTHRLDRVKAKALCEKILQQKDSSEGRVNCYNLLQDINSKTLSFSLELVNLPGQPFRSLVSYRNFNTLYLRVIKMDETLKKTIENQYDEKNWKAILAVSPLKTWEQNLPATTDLQKHDVEIKIDALPIGEYMLVAASDKNMTSEKTLLGARVFYVSSISHVNYKDDYFVLNRDSGKPLAGATVQVWEQVYDYTTSRYTRKKESVYKTDQNGFFRLAKRKQENNRYNYNYQLEITHGNDRLFMNESFDRYYYDIDNKKTTSTQTYFFTDRGIYRPGQLLYFKGIVISGDNRTNDIKPGFDDVIYLRNANGEQIDSIKVTANEFGSYSGKFQLPSSGLNGSYSLTTKKFNSTTTFQVEDYKRPKFLVDYEPLKGTYKVNDKIKVTGNAKAYAGNTIGGANVKYRVVRQSRYLYDWVFKRGWFPPNPPMEIAHGETTTNDMGQFVIEFTAIPDLKIDKKFEPAFDYTVYADVTDINGETRSGEKLISVGYKALVISATIPTLLPADSLKNLLIRTENLNGEFEPATVRVTINRLVEEKRLIRQRYWSRPDQFIMTKAEYISNFPFDEYDNESDPTSYEKGAIVLEKSDSSRINAGFDIGNLRLQPGYYAIQITARSSKGDETKDIKYIELFDEKDNKLSSAKYLWWQGSKPVEPGETTSVKIGSSADNLFIVQQTMRNADRNNETTNTYQFFTLNNEKKKIDFTPTEADRGGYGLNWIFVKHNRFYVQSDIIVVPWTNKKLNIEYATYRDKTLPGSEEKWKLRITGYKNEKLAAELLASMYDASLDQFYPHQWNVPAIWNTFYNITFWDSNPNFVAQPSRQRMIAGSNLKPLEKIYDRLIADETELRISRQEKFAIRGMATVNAPIAEQKTSTEVVALDAAANQADMSGGLIIPKSGDPYQPDEAVQIRKNFNETAFFFPDLRTDSSGAIEFSFTLPEALTKWKFQALAHTRGLQFGYSSKEIVTQKQLMVQPNAPRFLRQGDRIDFSAKVVNLTEKELKGQAELQLFDAATNQPVDNQFKNNNRTISFTLPAGQSSAVEFPLDIPVQFNSSLTWRIVAKASSSDNNFSDGEENALPVLTNRMLVTETLPLPVRGNETKNFSFDKLLQSGSSKTLQQYGLTVEYTSNPAWYAVQALPYLMEYPYDCAEQTWNRYYANSLASFIANSSPRIRQVFEKWKITDTSALMSNLQKNQELKSILLEETPWVLQAKSESDQKKNIALLFDMVRMSNELNGSYEKLKQMQSSNGGFVWFKGGPDDRYMTQYIVTGIGHLKKLKGVAVGQEDKLNMILAQALPYLDKKIKEDYDNLVKSKTDLKKYQPGYSEIQYLYMRSFFPNIKVAAASQVAYNYYRSRLSFNWTKQNKYMQGMIAIALFRTGDKQTPSAVLRSLKETSTNNPELGMYWKDVRSWWWYEAPIERQALLIEAFQEIASDTKTVDDLRTWLLKNKQTNKWESTKATAEACYALLLQGTQWLNSEPAVTIKLGSTTINTADEKQEAGTGYFKKTIHGETVKPDMGNISVTVSGANTGVTWGGVYWQYFEDLDKITSSATPLNLVKKLFVETNSDRGPVLTPVKDGDKLKVGDKIKVRIELRVDREMEYVHMKDMRASALEPVNVLSSYKWQGGLGYYESTRDAATNFFFSSLRRGTYVFEYPLFVTHSGNFSNGVTTIQSMYAPEFSSHSEGVRINVE